MEVDESDFLQELRQMVVRRASTMHLVDTMAFVTEVAERLEEDPVFGEFIQAEYSDVGAHGKQMRLHGFTEMDDSDGAVSMVIGRWVDEPAPGTLLTGDIEQMQGWLENFASEALTRKLDERIAEASPAYQLAHMLRNKGSAVSCIRFHIFSNQPLSQRYKRESRSDLAGVPTETHIWDLQRLAALYGSSREREAVEIHLADFGSDGIPCIEASTTSELTSYLCVIEGNVLADLYERYGSRLLEGNVRSFLGMRGGVNKGIRTTIQDKSAFFFAYNNGIAATAMSVGVAKADGTSRIVDISDLQIVNGGQTTASILRARKQDRLSLDGVTVPMKLSVVASDVAHDLVPKIAEFANTQNKVAVADFFANHTFHRKMEEISRRLMVPAKAGDRVQGKWFYERSRGQYQNERLYLSKSRKEAFDLEYPAKQVINKTELAKYDSTLREKPFWVSLGAQKNFIKFATQFEAKDGKTETEYWTEISPDFGEAYYQRIAAMAILWKCGEQIVSQARGGWYLGDYRPQIVAYAWALIFHNMRAVGKEPNMARVWELQAIDDAFADLFERAAKEAQRALLDLPAGSSNVGEWAKKEACWVKVAALTLDLGGNVDEWAIDKDESRHKRIEARRQGARDDGISLQARVVTLASEGYWRALRDWDKSREFILDSETRLLARAATPAGAARIATDREWKRLMEIKTRCEGEGFRFV
jgi:hypothetical protein